MASVEGRRRVEFETFQVEVRGQFRETLAAKLPSGAYLLPRLEHDWELWNASKNDDELRKCLLAFMKFAEKGDKWTIADQLMMQKWHARATRILESK